MVHTVGIIGVNGNVGAPTAKALAKIAEAGKVKLVIFHRESSDLSAFQKGDNVEFCVLDMTAAPEKIGELVKGVNVFMSVTVSYCSVQSSH